MISRLIVFLFICLIGIGNTHAQTMSSSDPLSLLAAGTTIAGSKISKASLSGKPLVITFFASWCPPCRHEFNQLNALKNHPRGKDANIIAINVFEDYGGKQPARMQRFLDATKPEFSVIKGTAEMRAAFGNITRIPTLIIYDRSGRETWRFVHKQGATKMSADLDEIVAALTEAVK